MKQKKKVLLIVHDLYQEDNHFPLGCAYIAAVLKKEGVDVKICCQDIFHYSNEELADLFLKNNDYDLIGIGFLVARFRETILDLCKTVNKYKKDAWLVLGGPGPTPIPKYVLEKTNADVIAMGEAEETIIELLKCKTDNGDLSKIKGIAYRKNGKTIINERRQPVRDLDSIPFPEWSLFPMKEYTTCFKPYRMTKNDKANYFFINDELFVFSKKRVLEFQDALEKNNLKIKFKCDARVDIFDKETVDSLKKSGCQFINFGMESSDQKVLDLMNKNTIVEQNIVAAEITNKAGVGLGLNFIWGNKGDTEESLKNNVKLIKKYNLYDQIRTIRPVTPYPGSDLYYEAIEKGLLSGPEDFFNKFKNSDLLTVNFTNIPEKKFYKLLFEANKELVTDYFMHTTKDMDKANKLIKDFYDLYFKRGARHYEKK